MATVSTGAESGTPPDPIVITHAPMSERQQLALIKRLEKANAQSQSNSGKQNYEDLFGDLFQSL